MTIGGTYVTEMERCIYMNLNALLCILLGLSGKHGKSKTNNH